MNHNGQHVVHYKGNPLIMRIGFCGPSSRKLAVVATDTRADITTSTQLESHTGRRLNARCKSSHATWIEDSSMSVDGDTWHGTVQGGEYHCMVSKNGGGNKYRVDCNKNGGKATDFFFDDGSDKYELLMNHNCQHVVHYKGNPLIMRIGFCGPSSRKLAVVAADTRADITTSTQLESHTGRRLNARCKSSHATWIEDSSMSVDGDTWHGTVQGGEYHCMV